MVICLEQGADFNMAQLMPLPLTVSCFSKIQIGFTFLVSAHPGSPGQMAVKQLIACDEMFCVFCIINAMHVYHCGIMWKYLDNTVIMIRCLFIQIVSAALIFMAL